MARQNNQLYKTSFYEPLESAKLKDKPVRLINFMKIHDSFRNRQILKLGEKSFVELSTRMIENKNENKLKTANSMTPLNMVNGKEEGDIINVTCHVNAYEETGKVDTTFGRKMKLNVVINDDSIEYPIRLTLWGSHVNKISQAPTGSRS